MKQLKLLGLTIISIIFLSLVTGHLLEKKNKKSRKAKTKQLKKIEVPSCLLIAVLIKKYSKKKTTLAKISKKLHKSCATLHLLRKVRTSLNRIREQVHVVKRRTKKISRKVYARIVAQFYGKLFKYLASNRDIKHTTFAKKINRASKNLKKSRHVHRLFGLTRRFARVLRAKGKKVKSKFNALRKLAKRQAKAKKAAAAKKQAKAAVSKNQTNKGPSKPANKPKAPTRVAKPKQTATKQKKSSSKSKKSKKTKVVSKKLRKINRKTRKLRKIQKRIRVLRKRCFLLNIKSACRKSRKHSKRLVRKQRRLSKSLKRKCKASKNKCMSKNNKKQCAVANKICAKSKKLRKSLKKSRKTESVHATAKIIVKAIHHLTRN